MKYQVRATLKRKKQTAKQIIGKFEFSFLYGFKSYFA
jgi:hypothetical protein